MILKNIPGRAEAKKIDSLSDENFWLSTKFRKCLIFEEPIFLTKTWKSFWRKKNLYRK